MAGETPEEAAVPPVEAPPRRRLLARPWFRRMLAIPLGILALLALAVVVLDSPIGHRYVADRITRLAPASGLRITVGRIEGSLYGQARLRDLTFADPQGVFARIPEAELDWRPTNWFRSGLDVRKLVLRRGTLLRLPKLNPGDPDAPILPDFDIRVDRLEIDRLTVAEGVLGSGGPQRVSLLGKADIRKGRALVRVDSRISGADRLFVLLDSEPSRDRFDMSLQYTAPRGGLLAAMAGAESALDIRAGGKGGFSRWDGQLLATQDGKRLAAVQLTNRSGRYGALGLVWPDGLLTGLPLRAAGNAVALAASGTLVDSVLRGDLFAQGDGLAFGGTGTVDLADNAFDDLRVNARVRDPALLGPGMAIEGGRLSATLDGPFRDLAVRHDVTVQRFVTGGTRFEGMRQQGTLTRVEGTWRLPLQLAVAQIVTGNATIDPLLKNGRATGTVTLAQSQVSSNDLVLALPGFDGRFALRGDVAKGGYGLVGQLAARGLAVPNIGSADASGKLVAQLRPGGGWSVSSDLDGRLAKVANPTLTTLAGTGIRFAGKVSVGSGKPLLFENTRLSGSKLALGLSGRRLANGTTIIVGRGRQADYGPFTIDASMAGDGPRAVLVFADPLPAAGLKDVRIALAPIEGGFGIDTQGQSTLGPFNGNLALFSPPGGPTRIEVRKLDVWQTSVSGALTLGDGGVAGKLALAGGGVDGTIDLAPRGGGQGFNVMLNARDAKFGGEVPLSIAWGQLEAQGLLQPGNTTITGNLLGRGIGQGRLFLGRVAANAQLTNGTGTVTAALAGRRGSRFNLQVFANVAPRRISAVAQGRYAGQAITMPRRAVLTAEEDGWRLAPTQFNFAGGRAIASGLVTGPTMDVQLALADMPLSLLDVVTTDLGLGGKISGLVDYRQPKRGLPTADLRVKVNGLTRSGLVLTSRPIDLAVVASLSPDRLEARAVAQEEGQTRGRLQGRITGLPADGALADRLRRGALFAQMRYDGPADALWRLAAIDAFDLTGPIAVAADATGTMDNPAIRGSLSSSGLRLQSSLTGTDISAMQVRGTFSGSRLVISSMSGRTADNGTVVGSGTFDLSGLGTRGPAIDLRLAARGARLLDRADMAATVTGPLAIRSDGVNGIIAGRVAIDKATWQLGRAAAAEQLPSVRTREINRAADIAPTRAAGAPWRFLIDARGENRVEVRGLGLDSEWGADIRLRGTTSAPAITGRADLVSGGYEFAGRRFELTRGRIVFDGNSPPNPRLDIAAEYQENNLTARVTVTGNSLKPEIGFSSTPALPEEELLSRLLFGTSITDISAPEALQLGAALASLRGGGGIDPINKLRRAIGLDRLRVIPADPALDRETAISAGKYLGRKFFVEIITDGRGYSATQLEFRVTNWLSLLGAVSTVGRESINVKASKDY